MSRLAIRGRAGVASSARRVDRRAVAPVAVVPRERGIVLTIAAGRIRAVAISP